ncbi:arginase family protein [Streptomyces sp. NPDC051985]|uniref:arginase family protein n=1 Tax=Streptomyces sp. NPDC051985 TaxID=3155807 RepID=UPI00341E9498
MSASTDQGKTLRLVWPQWQGAAPDVVALLTPELPLPSAQLGYHLGSRMLQWLAPAADGPEVVVPVPTEREGLTSTDGVFAREVVLEQLTAALAAIGAEAPDRIVTLGGECSVSVAPFAYLAAKYGEDLAVVWLDAHPDTGMPESRYDGYHAMAVSHILGHGDKEFVEALPATVAPSRLALAGLHVWEDDQEPFTTGWGLTTFAPADLEHDSRPLLEWLRATGCSKVALHLDVDSVDSNDIVLGLGMEPDGLSREAVLRTINDVAGVADVVGITVAEYLPRQVIAMRELLSRLPLLGRRADPAE